MRRTTRARIAGAAVATAALTLAPAANATYHENVISEVSPNPSGAGSGFVELQAYASGQNVVKGHSLTVYDAGGATVSTSQLGSNPPNGFNQSTILIGGSAAPGAP